MKLMKRRLKIKKNALIIKKIMLKINIKIKKMKLNYKILDKRLKYKNKMKVFQMKVFNLKITKIHL